MDVLFAQLRLVNKLLAAEMRCALPQGEPGGCASFSSTSTKSPSDNDLRPRQSGCPGSYPQFLWIAGATAVAAEGKPSPPASNAALPHGRQG
jgi:hypothetical protein